MSSGVRNVSRNKTEIFQNGVASRISHNDFNKTLQAEKAKKIMVSQDYNALKNVLRNSADLPAHTKLDQK
jgi:hypothetical protein